jgi:hypothetical protein
LHSSDGSGCARAASVCAPENESGVERTRRLLGEQQIISQLRLADMPADGMKTSTR